MKDDGQADYRLGAHVLGTLVRPGVTLRALAEQPTSRPGGSAVALLGVGWTLLLMALFVGGHAPSVVLLPLERESYYALQAFLMLPLLTGLWWLSSTIAHRLALAAGGTGTEGGARSALGFAYAAPMLAAHVLPELAAYGMAGFETMALVGRFSLALASLWVWALSAAALRVAHGVRLPVAIGASLAGLLAQAVVGGLVIR